MRRSHSTNPDDIIDVIASFTAEGYVPYPGVEGTYYKPFNDNPPHECSCVAIWWSKDNRVIYSEEF